jgi:hypothetical protein
MTLPSTRIRCSPAGGIAVVQVDRDHVSGRHAGSAERGGQPAGALVESRQVRQLEPQTTARSSGYASESLPGGREVGGHSTS